MVHYLLKRPIAVLITFIALLTTGIFLIWKIPVSLLPEIDVPKIVVRVDYPNVSAAVLEQNIVRPIRENLLNINGIKSIESKVANHTAQIYLTFEYNSRMDLVYIEVNEKLDRLNNSFPRDMQRPQVMRVNTSDIPVVRLQVLPVDEKDFLSVSMLTEKVLKKRLEQLDGVSMVDINGRIQSILTVLPKQEQLAALGLTEQDIEKTIREANSDIGGLNIIDGQYRYFVRLEASISSPEAIGLIPVRTKDGIILPLSRVAEIKLETDRRTGFHLYNGRQGLVITIQKQSSSRMNELLPAIRDVLTQFKKDYPTVDFALTQDQTFLLDAGIDNLYQDLVYGGMLTIILLFLFLGDWASPSLMSISIPVSLILSFILFFLCDISFNIISLSGLALGVGMLIDNSIVVIDSINRRRREGKDAHESAVAGTNEVITPVISQVLTTVAVYAPLILLSGIAGALVLDQSIALTISLGVSLLVAFVLVPQLYTLLQRKSKASRLKEDTAAYKWIVRHYHRMIDHIFRYKKLYFSITILVMPVGLWLATKVPVSSLPKIEKKESLLHLNWNSTIDAQENLRRVRQLLQVLQPGCTVTEAEIGLRQFLLQQENNTIQMTDLYYACKNEMDKMKQDRIVHDWLTQHYPLASFTIDDAPNAFTQLFSEKKPYFEARFKPLRESIAQWDSLPSVFGNLKEQKFVKGDGLVTEKSVSIVLDYEKMELYGIQRDILEKKLQQLFGTYTLTQVRRFGEVLPVRLTSAEQDFTRQLNEAVTGMNGALYPLNSFLTVQYSEQPKFITADKTGPYRAIYFDRVENVNSLENELKQSAAKTGYSVSFSGTSYEDRQQLNRLWLIFFIVLILLYVILAIQYESLLLPFLVMLTIPLGITGSMLLLWLTGGTLDVMAAVGLIVVLGLIVDDPILKIEVLTRLEKKYRLEGLKKDDQLMKKMIHEAGDICLKPLLMVSLTTSIALVPVLFINGIGNDLQKPLAIVIIGGLTIGTFFTTWFIPLVYWYYSKWIKK